MLRTYFPPSTYNLGSANFLVSTEIEFLFPEESLSKHTSIIKHKSKKFLGCAFLHTTKNQI